MILITDGREPQVQTHRYSDAAAVLYEYCGCPHPKDIASNFGEEPWIQPALDEFVSLDLMLFLDGRYLSLALPENRHFDLEAGPAHTGRSSTPEPASTSA